MPFFFSSLTTKEFTAPVHASVKDAELGIFNLQYAIVQYINPGYIENMIQLLLRVFRRSDILRVENVVVTSCGNGVRFIETVPLCCTR